VKTDDLISVLAADTMRPRQSARVLLLALIPALLVGVTLIWMSIGFRADLATAMVTPLSVMRIVLSGGLGIVALRIAYLLTRPEGREAARFWPLALIGVVALGLWVASYLATPAEARQMAIQGKTMVDCLTLIPILSILPVASVFMMLRQGATTAPAMAGFVAGLAGSGLAASIYALHCIEDSPLFYVTWYGLAIIGVTLVSTALGPRLLRW
jgi:hypothetical protein